MKRFLVLAAAVTAATGVSVASVSASSPRSGALQADEGVLAVQGRRRRLLHVHVVEPQGARSSGSRIVYLSPAGATSLDSDVVLEAGPGNKAFGHCLLVFATFPGSARSRAGPDSSPGSMPMSWSRRSTGSTGSGKGRYSFSPRGYRQRTTRTSLDDPEPREGMPMRRGSIACLPRWRWRDLPQESSCRAAGPAPRRRTRHPIRRRQPT